MLDLLISNYSAKLSQDIMTAWQFPPDLIKLQAGVNRYYENKNKADLADALLVAKIYVLRNKPSHSLTKLNKKELPCYNRLNLDPEKPLDEYPELADDLAAMKEIFK
jgi:HD-like signal output (HDOD) protein